MGLMQLSYVSQPFGFDEPMLAGILLDARRCNARDNVTGALIARDDLYLQLLEGSERAVEAAFERIARDDRHTDVRAVRRWQAERRLFGRWAMHDDPALSWMWSREAVAAGVPETTGPDETMAVFERLRATLPA